MRTVGAVLVLGMLVGAWAMPALPPMPVLPLTQVLPSLRPMCDSPEVEAAAFSALDYINSHHKHGYKYALNRIEEVKVILPPAGGVVYIVELDLLQTTCHAMDPTPLANCTVRTKPEMTVEAECDAAVSKVDGVFSLMAFKCKSKPDSREHFCVGCVELLPLNHTTGLQLVDFSLATFNKQSNDSAMFALLEVVRMTTQVISKGAMLTAEFVVVETNCSHDATGACVPLPEAEARHSICHASSFGQPPALSMNCKFFATMPAPVAPATNDTVAEEPHVTLPQQDPAAHGHMHHKLIHIHLHEASATGLLSESNESGEVPVVKRDAPADPGPSQGPPPEVMGPGIQLCPGRLRYF